MKLSDTSNLTQLGSSGTKYNYEGADKTLLEAFPNPANDPDGSCQGPLTIEIVAPEFTSLCPLTGQPDFATIVVKYAPKDKCVESKSLKLYLGSFRQVGEFHEACVTRIAKDLIALLDPLWLIVEGQFTPRGGIKFWPTFRYLSDEASIEDLLAQSA